MRVSVKNLLSPHKRRSVPNHDNYDLAAVNTRLYRAMYLLGRTRVELAEYYGLDTSRPLCEQPNIPQATTENILKAATFLGVSMSWLTTGEPCSTVDHYVCAADTISAGSATAALEARAGNGSAIVQDAQNTSVVIKHFHSELSEFEQMFIERYRALDAHGKDAVWARLLELNAMHSSPEA